ncbi:hypothetical protein TorRG33x02_270900, partial [Trema orientale]
AVQWRPYTAHFGGRTAIRSTDGVNGGQTLTSAMTTANLDRLLNGKLHRRRTARHRPWWARATPHSWNLLGKEKDLKKWVPPNLYRKPQIQAATNSAPIRRNKAQ